VRILTFNCFGVPLPAATGARLATLGRLLDGAGHDIICLQEVQFSGFLPLLRRSFASFPHLIYQPNWHSPKGGLVTLSRWPVERVDFVPFREHGPWWYTPALADWLLHKGMLVTRIVVGGAPVVVVNTHLLANYSGDWSPGNRFARHQRERRRLARGHDVEMAERAEEDEQPAADHAEHDLPLQREERAALAQSEQVGRRRRAHQSSSKRGSRATSRRS
jgi:hypothetical protein